MKLALLEVNPKNCKDCPLYHKPWCELSTKEVEAENEIPDWCRLVGFPEYRSLSEDDDHPINDGYALGWNAVLSKITREGL